MNIVWFIMSKSLFQKIVEQKGRQANSDKGWRGEVSQMLTIAEKGGTPDFGLRKMWTAPSNLSSSTCATGNLRSRQIFSPFLRNENMMNMKMMSMMIKIKMGILQDDLFVPNW